MIQNTVSEGFNNIEKEIILLKAIIEMINDMVNHEMLKIVGESSKSVVYFNTSTHMNYFYIILVDFFSNPDHQVFGIKNSYLNELLNVCNNPFFNQNNSISNLKKNTQKFIDWLETEVVIPKMWLPSIDLELDLKIKRKDFINISGNIYKHNFTRLTFQVKKIKQLFKKNGKDLNDEQILMILDEFHEKFAEDVLHYNNSIIVEFLNNIRWGIQEYLLPEYKHSCTTFYDERIKCNGYKYKYPSEIVSPFVKTYYWNLMNDIRSKPYISKFKIWEEFKKL